MECLSLKVIPRHLSMLECGSRGALLVTGSIITIASLDRKRLCCKATQPDRVLVDHIRRGQRHTPRPSTVFVLYITDCVFFLIYCCFYILRALPRQVQLPFLERYGNHALPYDISLAPTHHPPYLYYCFGIWIGQKSRTMGSSPASRILRNSTSLLRCYLHLSSDRWVTCPTPL